MRWVLTICAFLLLTAAPASAGEDNPRGHTVPTAEVIYAAHEEGKSAVVMATLATFRSDLLELGAGLFEAHARATAGGMGSVSKSSFLALIEKIATRGKHLSGAAALLSMHKRWASLSDADWQLNQQLCLVVIRLQILNRFRMQNTILRLSRLRASLRQRAPPTLFRWRYDRYVAMALGKTGQLKKARAMSRTSGREAQREGWFGQASRAYRSAGEFSLLLKDFKGMRGDEDAAWAAIQACGNADTIARTGIAIAAQRLKRQKKPEGVAEILERAQAAAGRARDPKIMYNVLTLRWNTELRVPGNDPDLQVAREHVAYAKKRKNVEEIQNGLYRLGQAQFSLGQIGRSLETFEEALRLKPAKPKPRLRYDLLSLKSQLLNMLHETPRAIAAIRDMRSIAEAQGWRVLEADAKIQLASSMLKLGQFDQATASTKAALAMLRPGEGRDLRGKGELLLGQIEETLERWDQAQAHYDRALATLSADKESAYYRTARIVRAGLDVHRGRPLEALKQLRELRTDPGEIVGASAGHRRDVYTGVGGRGPLSRESPIGKGRRPVSCSELRGPCPRKCHESTVAHFPLGALGTYFGCAAAQWSISARRRPMEGRWLLVV